MAGTKSARQIELERIVRRNAVPNFTHEFFNYIKNTESLTGIIPGMKRSGKNALVDQIITYYLENTKHQIWFFKGQEALIEAFDDYSKLTREYIDPETEELVTVKVCEYIDMSRIHATDNIADFENEAEIGEKDIVFIFDEGALSDETNANKHNTNAATLLTRFLAISSHNRVHSYFLAQRMTMLNAAIRSLASFIIYRKLSPQNMSTIKTVARDSLVCDEQYASIVRGLDHHQALFINEGELRANFGPEDSDQVGTLDCYLSPHWEIEDQRYHAWKDDLLDKDGYVEIEGVAYEGLTANRFSEQFRGMKVSEIATATEKRAALLNAKITEMATEIINIFSDVTHENRSECAKAFSYLRSKYKTDYVKGAYEIVIDVVKEWNRVEGITAEREIGGLDQLEKSLDLQKMLMPKLREKVFFKVLEKEYNDILHEISQTGQKMKGKTVNEMAVTAWRYRNERGYTVEQATTTAGYSSGQSGSGAIKRVQGLLSHTLGKQIEKFLLKELKENTGFIPVKDLGGTGQPDIVLRNDKLGETWVIEVKHTAGFNNLSLGGKKYRASMREAYNILYNENKIVRFFIICVNLKHSTFYILEMPLEPRQLMRNKDMRAHIDRSLSDD